MTNANRAQYGLAAIEHGTPDFGKNGRDKESELTDVADALTNIMHLCTHAGLSFDEAVETARRNHDAEVYEALQVDAAAGDREDHCPACGATDDGTQTYCACGEALVDEKYIPDHVTPPGVIA